MLLVIHVYCIFTKVPVPNGCGIKERKLFSGEMEHECLRRGSVPATDCSQVLLMRGSVDRKDGCSLPPIPTLRSLSRGAGIAEGLHPLNRWRS